MKYKDDEYVVTDDGIRDMYLAALILSYGGKIDQIVRDNPRRQIFYFDLGEVDHIYILEGGIPMRYPNPNLEDIKRHYASQAIFAPPSIFSSIRSVKSAIHN